MAQNPDIFYFGPIAFSGSAMISADTSSVQEYEGNLVGTASYALIAQSVVGAPIFDVGTGLLNLNSATFVGYSQFNSFPVQSITGNENIGYIGDSGFINCDLLISASFPTASNIGMDSFRNSLNLSYANFPVCSDLGYAAFRNCPSLKNAIFPVATDVPGECFYGTGIVSASFPVATIIGDQGLYLCPSMSYVDIPNATLIENNGMQGATSLQSVNFPVMTTLFTSTLADCPNLSSVNMPLLTTMGASNFTNNKSLPNSLTFPSLTTMGNSNFTNCGFTSLSQSILPLITSLPTSTFSNNTTASSAVFENVTIISSSAFNGCSALTNVSFPSATWIGASAFDNTGIISTSQSFDNVTTVGTLAFNTDTLQTASFAKLETLTGVGVFTSANLRKVELPAITASSQVVNIVNAASTTIREVLLDGITNAIVANTNLIGGRTTLVTASFASASAVAASQFSGCTNLKYINLSKLTGTTGLGGSVANNSVFLNTPVSGTLIVPTFYATCQTGSLPDSDIVYLINRGWTINYV